MEKYKEYREEIAQSAMLGQSVFDSDKTIEKYRQEINEINPAILNSSKSPSLSFTKSITEVSLKQKEIPLDVAKAFKNLNKAKSTYNKENISLMLFNLKNNTILDQNSNIKEEWLLQNADYASLVDYKKKLNINPTALEKDLQEKYAAFISTNDLSAFDKFNKISEGEEKHASSFAFAISIAIAIVFFAITLVLLILKLVYY